MLIFFTFDFWVKTNLLVVVGFVIQPIHSPCSPRLVVAVVQCDACDMLRKPFAAAKKRSRQKQHTDTHTRTERSSCYTTTAITGTTLNVVFEWPTETESIAEKNKQLCESRGELSSKLAIWLPTPLQLSICCCCCLFAALHVAVFVDLHLNFTHFNGFQLLNTVFFDYFCAYSDFADSLVLIFARYVCVLAQQLGWPDGVATRWHLTRWQRLLKQLISWHSGFWCAIWLPI